MFSEEIVVLPECGSTHELLKSQLVTGKLEWGATLMAVSQTKGLGMLGTSWLSEKAENLTISFSFQPETEDSRFDVFLSMAAALAVFDLLAPKLSQNEIKIKWPNDLMVFHEGKFRKVCGILIEKLKMEGKTGFLIGIGLNVNQIVFPESLNAVSLLNVSCKYESLIEMAHQLKDQLAFHVNQMQEEKFGEIKASYTQKLLGYGEKRVFRKNGEFFEGVVIGVGDVGELCLSVNNHLKRFGTKELEWVF